MSQQTEVAVKVKGVTKTFRLPHERVNSLKSIILHPVRFLRMHKNFERQEVLKNVNLTVNKGEFFGILGRNGSGKSTLLKIIANIYDTDKGSVEIYGRLLPFIELGVGFNGELTGRDNVYLSGALFGFTDKEITINYKEIVDFAELNNFMDQKLKNYSTGMHVRLAFSVVTILSRGDILLLDEVLAVGDINFQNKCFAYFKELKRQKKTVLFVTHNMNAVRDYCDRAVLIDNHKIVCCGSADIVASRYSELLAKSTN